jgi:hypothetical protein
MELGTHAVWADIDRPNESKPVADSVSAQIALAEFMPSASGIGDRSRRSYSNRYGDAKRFDAATAY